MSASEFASLFQPESAPAGLEKAVATSTIAAPAPASPAIAAPPAGAKVQTVGRDLSCTLVLDNPAVSSRHLSLNYTAQGAVATDLGSASGTYINGARLMSPRLLARGDVVTVGGIQLNFNGRSLVRPSGDMGFTISVSNLGTH